MDISLEPGIQADAFDSTVPCGDNGRIEGATLQVVPVCAGVQPVAFVIGSGGKPDADCCIVSVNASRWGMSSDNPGFRLLDSRDGRVLVFLPPSVHSALVRHSDGSILGTDKHGIPFIRKEPRGATMLSALGVRIEGSPVQPAAARPAAARGRGKRSPRR